MSLLLRTFRKGIVLRLPRSGFFPDKYRFHHSSRPDLQGRVGCVRRLAWVLVPHVSGRHHLRTATKSLSNTGRQVATDRCVEQLDWMHGGQLYPGSMEAGDELQKTARIAGRQQVRACAQHMRYLAVAKLPRGLRLQKVVDAG